jgi:hypothetical protein
LPRVSGESFRLSGGPTRKLASESGPNDPSRLVVRSSFRSISKTTDVSAVGQAAFGSFSRRRLTVPSTFAGAPRDTGRPCSEGPLGAVVVGATRCLTQYTRQGYARQVGGRSRVPGALSVASRVGPLPACPAGEISLDPVGVSGSSGAIENRLLDHREPSPRATTLGRAHRRQSKNTPVGYPLSTPGSGASKAL